MTNINQHYRDKQQPEKCCHGETYFLPDPWPTGENIEVCNCCGVSRSHWEQGESSWININLVLERRALQQAIDNANNLPPTKKKIAKKKSTFSIGQKISLAGYLYEVVKMRFTFFTLKFCGSDPAESRTNEHKRRMSKGDSFRVGDNNFKVISGTAGVWLRCRLKK